MRFIIFFLLLMATGTGKAQDFSVYEKHYFNAPELNLPYRYLRPLNYDSSQQYPLIIFFARSF